MSKPIQGQSGTAMVHSNVGQLAREEFLRMWPFMAGKSLDDIYAFGRQADAARRGPARGDTAPAEGVPEFVTPPSNTGVNKSRQVVRGSK